MADAIASNSKQRGKWLKKSNRQVPEEDHPGPSSQTPTRASQGNSCSSKATEKVERLRDKVLQRLCEQSSKHTAASYASPPPQEPSGDQLALDTPGLANDNTDIWGSADFGGSILPPTAAVTCGAGPSVSSPAQGALPSGAVPAPFDPANFQMMIVATVQQGMAASLQSLGRSPSLASGRSLLSLRHGEHAGPSNSRQSPDCYSEVSDVESQGQLLEEDE